MNDNGADKIAQQKQNNLSAGLIFLNIILAVLYVTCIPQQEDDLFAGLLAVAVITVLLQAIFVFSYKGKAPLLSKWLLLIFFLVAAGYTLFIGYVMALGKAFQH
jgi:glucan phosphoethanolaminetransferase (alkaline phosphatase superfamily)